MEERVEHLYSYRWVILVTCFCVHALLQFGLLITSAMGALLMSPLYGFTPMEFSMIATMPYLVGFIFGIVSGAWADRKSIKLVMIFGLSIATVGGLLRCVSTSFPILLISSFLLGFALAALNANSAKIFRLWFPGRMTSVAMGIYILGATVGIAPALKIGVTLTNATSGFIMGAVCVAVALVMWIVLGRTHPDGESESSEPMTMYLGVVLKNKWVWLIAFIMMFAFGSSIVENNFLSAGLVQHVGSVETAGTIAAINNLAVGVFGIVMPLLLGRFKNLKPVFIAAAFLMAASCVVLFAVPYSAITWVILILQGVFMGVLLPMGKTLPALIPDMKPEYLGAVGGIQSSFQNLGAWILPAYIIAPIATAIDGGTTLTIFIGAAIACAIAGILMFFLPETGTYVKTNIEK